MVRLAAADTYESLTYTDTEKRELQSIEWESLGDTCESISGFIDDRIPFRNIFISAYRVLNNGVTDIYQKWANAIMADQTYEQQVTEAVDGSILIAQDQIEGNTKGNYVVPIIRGQTVEGSKGWLFLASEDELLYYAGTNILDDETTEKYANTAQHLQELCQEQGKELYIMIVPNKSQVYSVLMPTFEVETLYKREQRLLDYINENTDVKMIYPLTELSSLIDYVQVYYKYDSHWNDYGAYVGLNCLYSAMGLEQNWDENFELNYVEAQEFDLCDLGFIDRDSVDPDYEYQVAFRPEVTVSDYDEEDMIINTTSDGMYDKNLVLVGDSYRVMLEQYLTKDFTHCTIAHRDYVSSIKKELKDADIIVVSAVERYDDEAFESMEDIISILEKN